MRKNNGCQEIFEWHKGSWYFLDEFGDEVGPYPNYGAAFKARADHLIQDNNEPIDPQYDKWAELVFDQET